MLNTVKTYLFIIKVMIKMGGSVKKWTGDTKAFYRSNVIRVLGEDGEDLFNFLANPKSKEEIVEKYQYTDMEYLDLVLKTLIEDKTLKQVDSKYQTIEPVMEKRKVPSVFNESVVEVLEGYAKNIPSRLKGQYNEFCGGPGVYSWDDALALKLYEWIRKCAFIFAGALKRSGKFLDIGCGNGVGTTAIWEYFNKKKRFFPETKMEIIGLEPDEVLLTIAKEEFELRVKSQLGYSKEEIDSLKQFFPKKFKKGSVTDIPFDDNTFDIVYISQVLHWTNPRKSFQEMLRVAKPGALIFGAQVPAETSNKFMDLHMRTVDGAEGFFPKADIIKWLEDAGGKEVKTATPILVFKCTK